MLDLTREGSISPSADQVALRAGVGLRSVFRHFSDMASLYGEMHDVMEAELRAAARSACRGATWRERLLELIERRSAAFERSSPRSPRRRDHPPPGSSKLQAEHARLAEALRVILMRETPEALRDDAARFEALDLLLSYEAWSRLRDDQGLSPKAARAATAVAVRRVNRPVRGLTRPPRGSSVTLDHQHRAGGATTMASQGIAAVGDAAQDDEVLYSTADHIATITLNRPQRMNTISGPMLRQLTERLLEADADREVRVVVLTGTGRAFCAGLDLTEVVRPSQPGDISNVNAGFNDLDLRNTPPTVLFNLGNPTICALNGSAAGYGMDTALGCDIRIMAESAKMAAAFTKRGIVPESGGTWFLPRLIGWSKAAELISHRPHVDRGAVPGAGPGVVRRARRGPRRRGARPGLGDRRQRAAGGAGVEENDADGPGRGIQ